MILPESRNLEWIEKAAKDNNASNPILVDKVIRAFSLLDVLTEVWETVSGFRFAPPATDSHPSIPPALNSNRR